MAYFKRNLSPSFGTGRGREESNQDPMEELADAVRDLRSTTKPDIEEVVRKLDDALKWHWHDRSRSDRAIDRVALTILGRDFVRVCRGPRTDS